MTVAARAGLKTRGHALFAAGLVVVVALLAGAAWSYAQVIAPRPVTPVVLAGPDIGFRMQAVKGGTPVGQLVVRVNGEWRTVEFGQTPLPLVGR